MNGSPRQQSGVIGVLILLAAGLIYALISTRPPSLAVESEVNQAAGARPLDAGILNDSRLTELETLRLFGPRPVAPLPEAVGRRNPFEGL